jgi:hypothetical protein
MAVREDEMRDLYEQALSAIDDTLRYIEQSGYATYDPNDVLDTPLYWRIKGMKGSAGGAAQRLYALAITYAPIWSRKLLNVEKRATPGGVACLSMLHTALNRPAAAKECLEWLLDHSVSGRENPSWGFPFSWQGSAFFPAGTAIGHTTMTCGNAFLAYYRNTGDGAVLDKIGRICSFFVDKLNHVEFPGGGLSLSYTPLDRSAVINTNADNACLILQYCSHHPDRRLSEVAERMLKFVLDNQNDDGSWYYYAKDFSGGPSIIDSYHTGMVLSALIAVYKLNAGGSQNFRIYPAIERGLKFFLEKLITAEGYPKYHVGNTHPEDIYSFAQTVITLLDALEILPDGELCSRTRDSCLGTIAYLLRNMRSKNGGFLHRRVHGLRADIGSLRWANALTAFALVRATNELLK